MRLNPPLLLAVKELMVLLRRSCEGEGEW